jgi:hypothetical protein
MKYENITPADYVERDFCQQVHLCLEEALTVCDMNEDILLLVRGWEQPPPFPQQKYISIVTSAEGHMYVPPEKDDPNCLGVFMHYYPKPSLEHQYDPDTFLTLDNVYPLPLGETKFFKGNHLKPILERDINVSFIGQYDQYRRKDFLKEVGRCASHIEDSVFHFYDGWNNGIGEKYSDIMSNTKIALVPCGSASLDTFRFYEAARCGCVIISCPQNRYEFMKGSPHIESPTWNQLKEGLELLLSRTDRFEAISELTKEFWETNLSPCGAANYIFSKIEGKICKT